MIVGVKITAGSKDPIKRSFLEKETSLLSRKT
jgi:hypothetical protein